VAKGFSLAADWYDRWAIPQQQIANTLISCLTKQIPCITNTERILDLGCGTGCLTKLLHATYYDAVIQGIDIAPGMIARCKEQYGSGSGLSFTLGDIENFSSSSTYDIIASSCVFQWLKDVKQVVARLHRLLNPGGTWAVAIPIKGSFHELHEAYRAVLGYPFPGICLHDEQICLSAFRHEGIKVDVFRTETFTYNLCRVEDVLRYFKNIGADYRYQPDYNALSFKEVKALLAYYKKTYQDSLGKIPVTYHVLYLLAGKLNGESIK
jgi:malonyl-CoA O-methyltransferase